MNWWFYLSHRRNCHTELQAIVMNETLIKLNIFSIQASNEFQTEWKKKKKKSSFNKSSNDVNAEIVMNFYFVCSYMELIDKGLLKYFVSIHEKFNL